jgi:hypothetical protein
MAPERFMMYLKAAPWRNSSTNNSLVLGISRYVGPSLPADLSNDFLMGEFSRRTVTTISHYDDGCLVGKWWKKLQKVCWGLMHSEFLMVQPLLCHRAPILG